jgi:hypothetical protein
MESVRRGSDAQVMADARRIVSEPEGSDYVPTDARELCGRIMHTCYMGTENSSVETRGRAKELAEAIGRSVSSLLSPPPPSSRHFVLTWALLLATTRT